MITPEEALDLVIAAGDVLAPQAATPKEALDHVLAEDIVADGDHPAFDRSMMDGFAVRLADAGKRLVVAGEIPAGAPWPGELPDGKCLEIFTGAPCPSGAEAVVQKEHVKRDGQSVQLPPGIKPGQNIARTGSDCRKGERVLHAGQVVNSLAVGTMAAFGIEKVQVRPWPVVGIIVTGGEFPSPDGKLKVGQIRNSNGPMLYALAHEIGVKLAKLLSAEDDLESLERALQVAGMCDIIVLTGGVSAGKYDLVPQALERFGAEVVFHGVKQRPGKPILFARKRDRLIFGLPGNPLSSHFGFHRYVAPAVRKMSGRPAAAHVHEGQLATGIEIQGGRSVFLPAIARRTDDAPPHWTVELCENSSSAGIFRACGANCYVEFAAECCHYQPGDRCGFTWIGREWGADIR